MSGKPKVVKRIEKQRRLNGTGVPAFYTTKNLCPHCHTARDTDVARCRDSSCPYRRNAEAMLQ